MRAALILLLAPALPQDLPKPDAFDRKGRLVCLLEEMKDRHGVQIAPIHEHVLGFRVEGKVPESGFRYYTVLRTRIAEGLFVDKRFKDRDLRLLGQVFPGSAVLEVGRYQWWKDGKLQDVFYWCEVCSIKSSDPGTCACCQAMVELREEPSKED